MTPITYEAHEGAALIRIDDGKANALSIEIFGHLKAALDRAEADALVPVITGRPGIFSAGFHLGEMMGGDPEILHRLLTAGARFAMRLLAFPHPVVTACNGHAFPMGTFIMMSADYRYGVPGPYRIGMNEVAIKVPVPLFAIELAASRLTPAHFARTVMTGEMFDPQTAVTAGFLDELVADDALIPAALERARAFSELDVNAHRLTKARARKPVIDAMTYAVEAELTVEKLRARLAA